MVMMKASPPGNQQSLLYGVVLNAMLWCLLVSLYFFFYATLPEDKYNNADFLDVNATLAFLQNTSYANPNASLFLKPVIWISGMSVTFSDRRDGPNTTWMSDLPTMFFER